MRKLLAGLIAVALAATGVRAQTVTPSGGSGTVTSVACPSGTVTTSGNCNPTSTATPAQGDILYYNGSVWVDLAPGTSGTFLKTQGASANPIWAAASGSGTVTSVVCPSGTITTSGNCNPLASTAVSGDVITGAGTAIPQDSGTLLSSLLPKSGGTLTGKLTTVASATGGAGFNLPQGSAPTSPSNGDLWTTSSGVFAQIAGATVGPFGTGAGSGTVTSVVCPSGTITTSGNCNPTSTGSPAQGDVLYYNGSAWIDLAPGTSGQFLETLGASANPLWATASGGSGCTVSGTAGQIVYNNGSTGCLSSAATITSGGAITLPANDNIVSGNGAASTPASIWTGTVYTGGSGSTTEPLVYIDPASTATSAWNTNGTLFGVNAISGFSGNLADFQTNGTSELRISNSGAVTSAAGFTAGTGSTSFFVTVSASSNVSVGGTLTMSTASSPITWSGRDSLTSTASGVIQLGLADAASPVAQTLSVQNVVAGTSNTAGAATLINGSKSTGSGAGGSITLQTTSNTAAATTQNTEVPVLTLDSAQHGTFGNTTNPPTCGTGCASLSAASTDQRMTITSGSAVTAVTVNFGKTWINTPVCISETNSATDLSAITAISTTAVTVTVATAITSGPVYLICE